MIKINLIPHGPRLQHQKQTMLWAQVGVAVGMVCLTLAGCWIWGSTLLQHRDDLIREKNSKEHELEVIVKENHEAEILKEQQNLLLESVHFPPRHRDDKKILPIAILDEISKSLEPLELWLVALSINQQDVSIEGQALSRKDVRQFIGILEENSIFGQLSRMETQPQHSRGKVIQQFSLQFTTQG